MRSSTFVRKVPVPTIPVGVILAGVILAGTTPSRAEDVAAKPVRFTPPVEDGKALFSGAAIARIVGLREGGDGYVSVRAAPSTEAAELDRLTASRRIIALTPPTDWDAARFIGVIYPAGGGDATTASLYEVCDVSEIPPTAPPFDRPYTGPCRSGWVHKRFIEVLAD